MTCAGIEDDGRRVRQRRWWSGRRCRAGVGAVPERFLERACVHAFTDSGRGLFTLCVEPRHPIFSGFRGFCFRLHLSSLCTLFGTSRDGAVEDDGGHTNREHDVPGDLHQAPYLPRDRLEVKAPLDRVVLPRDTEVWCDNGLLEGLLRDVAGPNAEVHIDGSVHALIRWKVKPSPERDVAPDGQAFDFEGTHGFLVVFEHRSLGWNQPHVHAV